MFDGAISELIEQLGKLPGVGPKSAQRIAFYVLQNPNFDPLPLANSLETIREKVNFCEVCGMLASDTQCSVCMDPRRDGTVLCVVEEAKDVWAIERTREYRGRYHVLGGALSPMDGVGPDQLRIGTLFSRVGSGGITEVIIATDPNLEGEATASYLSRALADTGILVTRLASGLPVGGDLEYADEVTLGRAFAGRRSL
jgi:recombination protein RecR